MAKKWNEMTPKERRIALAKDVIQRIRMKELNVCMGNGYVVPFDHLNIKDLDGPITKTECKTLQKHCEVCARGGLMLSRIDKFNSIEWKDVIGTDIFQDSEYLSIEQEDTTKALKGAFSENQLNLIEAAFEIDAYTYCGLNPPKKKQARGEQAETFGESYDNDSDRLMAICQNIVDHGEFRPEVEYEII